jgi:serine/threonine protein kinase
MLRDEPISEKVDLYGFGIMLWEMYTGKLPWSDKNYHQMIHTVAVSFFSLVVLSCCTAPSMSS